MATITIDGQELTVPSGTTVIQAAERLGIYVPRYCYHPGLSIAGSCRMCLVEVEGMPKQQIACYTRVQDGMKVHTSTEQVLHARKSMLEFLLTNHPLDCPVCDQSGECDLQNFYMEIGRYQSRFLENKVKRKKAFPIGPHVMLDQERCILCTRCTRFTEEVSKSNELGVFQRGNRSAIDLYPGRVLDNNYSGNVIDICPVGALTERQFRFQCRVWYLQTEESICNGCSRGCNISLHFNGSGRQYKAGGKRIQRVKPRFNPHVNRWWICDEGRFGFEFIDQKRIEYPQLRRNGGLKASDWDEAVEHAATLLKGALDRHGPDSVAVIASPQLSNEELYLVRKLFGELLGIRRIACRNPWEEAGEQDDFLLRADRNPNGRGAEELKLNGDTADLLEQAAQGALQVVYIFQHDFPEEPALAQLRKVPHVIYQGTNWNRTAELAEVVLASATYAEKDGTFTNFEGRIQRFQQAVLPLEDSQGDIEILGRLAGHLGQPLVYRTAEDLFMEWQGRSYQELDLFGDMLPLAADGAKA